MKKEVLKRYEMPYKEKSIEYDNTTMSMKYSLDIAFEEITKSFAEQTDDAIINYLYEKYKDTNVSSIFVLSRPDFEEFLLEMLPKYMKKRGKLKC